MGLDWKRVRVGVMVRRIGIYGPLIGNGNGCGRSYIAVDEMPGIEEIVEMVFTR